MTKHSHSHRLAYKRVLLKLSGEALAGEGKFGISTSVMTRIAQEIKTVQEMGVELAIVIGGGNIFRGISDTAKGMDRSTADYMGMLATVLNSLALQDCLEKLGVYTRVMSAIEMNTLCESYIRRRAVRHMEKNRIVIFAAGTGNPFFTTDTAASLRAMEIGAEVIFKATKVDGVFDSDPMVNKDAKLFSELTYIEVLQKNLAVMDSTAISLCMDNNLPIRVFNLNTEGTFKKVVLGEKIGTVVRRKQ